MSNINLNLYKIFCKVAESKSLSEASEKLNLSTSNISMQITNLEEQLGLKLLNRENKGITLTDGGKEIYNAVSKSISSFDFAEKMVSEKNSIKIACPSHFTTYFLMNKIEELKKKVPNCNVSIICEANIQKMLDLLQNHEIDFIISDAYIEKNNIVIKELLEIKNIFVSKAPLTLANIKEIEDLNCILNLENTKSTMELKELLQKYDVHIKSSMCCDATEIRVDAVKRNMGIAYVIKEAVKEELERKELYEVNLPIKLPAIHLNLIYQENELTKLDKQFINEYLNK